VTTGRSSLALAVDRMRARRTNGWKRGAAVLVAATIVAVFYYRDRRRTEPDAARDVYFALMPEISADLMRRPVLGRIFDHSPFQGVGNYLYFDLAPLGLTRTTTKELRLRCRAAALGTLREDERPHYINVGKWDNWSRLAGPVRYESLAASVRRVVVTHAEFRRSAGRSRTPGTDLAYVKRLGHLVGLAELDRGDLDGLAEEVAIKASLETPVPDLAEAFETALDQAR